MPRLLCPFVVLIAAVVVGFVRPASAQPDELRWGRVPDADLSLAAYAPDPDAAAVVLGDEGRVRFRRNLNVVYERHRRVKVFTPAGYDHATFQITYDPDVQDLEKVEGQTFVLGADGRTRKVRLDRGSIFEEDVDGDLRRVRFTLPALEPGAVFE
ncbi:MAG: DUF3857 domain-containing protein, partial [Rhodothermales bacterium]|nr:DUF3857 domain-containing protein [Rhodothermales bacterium]